MGDVVEQILERQIPALRDLVDRRLMTSEEVKGIVEQRRQFECECFFSLKKNQIKTSCVFLFYLFILFIYFLAMFF